MSIFRNKLNNQPNGFALGSIEGLCYFKSYFVYCFKTHTVQIRKL